MYSRIGKIIIYYIFQPAIAASQHTQSAVQRVFQNMTYRKNHAHARDGGVVVRVLLQPMTAPLVPLLPSVLLLCCDAMAHTLAYIIYLFILIF